MKNKNNLIINQMVNNLTLKMILIPQIAKAFYIAQHYVSEEKFSTMRPDCSCSLMGPLFRGAIVLTRSHRGRKQYMPTTGTCIRPEWKRCSLIAKKR